MKSQAEIAALKDDVLEHARWWRDHPGAPGRKLIRALAVLDDAEGRVVMVDDLDVNGRPRVPALAELGGGA